MTTKSEPNVISDDEFVAQTKRQVDACVKRIWTSLEDQTAASFEIIQEMNPQVFMSKRNGQLAIGKALYIERSETIENEHATLTGHFYELIGWAVFVGDECQGLWTDEQIDVLPFERLGDL